jgi:hypothetical protein
MRRIRRNGNSVVEDGRGIGRDHRLLGGIVGIVVVIVIIKMVDGEKEMGMADDDEMIPCTMQITTINPFTETP